MKKILIIFLLGIATTVVAQTKPTAEQVRQDRARGIVLPESEHQTFDVRTYVEDKLDADYIHASEAAYEAFRDVKFSVRIVWGIYNIWELQASQGMRRLPDDSKIQEYHSLHKIFNPTEFNAQEWMDFFKRCGMQAFAFITKHHDGFSMFHTKTRVKQRVNYLNPQNPIEPCDVSFSIEETPFGRDIVGELCEAARKNDVKINLYYSHPDWYDADFRPYCGHPLTTPDRITNPQKYGTWGNNFRTFTAADRTREETDRMVARHRKQLRELLTNYGAIDMICLDMYLGGDIWNETKNTVKMMRQLQPDVMIRARGIGNYGDYYTPENFVPKSKENTNMPWMVIYPLGDYWCYFSDSTKYKKTDWVIHNLIDAVAKGGSFMVGIGPDKTGRFHPVVVERLEAVGDWLKVNGEGIYETRARDVWKSGDIRFTRSKDNKRVYAFVEKFPEKELIIPSVTPKKKSKVRLLGYNKPLKWSLTSDGSIRIEIPDTLQSPENRPCEYAWAFRIENE